MHRRACRRGRDRRSPSPPSWRCRDPSRPSRPTPRTPASPTSPCWRPATSGSSFGTPGRRLLRFTTIIVNIGHGPFQLSGYDDDGFAAKKDILSVNQQILEPDGTFSPHHTDGDDVLVGRWA